ncbi:MAG: hypothetical protein LAP87_02165 [Acidobacteriia bacterium]|nr:hypothetical protein [Terriglobia bacterium]
MAATAEIGLAIEPVRIRVPVEAGTAFSRSAVPNALEYTMRSSIAAATVIAGICCSRMAAVTIWSTLALRSVGAAVCAVAEPASTRTARIRRDSGPGRW